jgi:uncharacterized FAD-dependent dehydrogenase
MQTEITCRLLPSLSENGEVIRQCIAEATGKPLTSVSGYYPVKRSIDARGKEPVIQLTLKVFIDEPFQPRPHPGFRFQDVRQASKQVIIIGAGPAGLFAALDLIESGIRPLILERGKDVRARRRDLAAMNKEGIVDPDSNYCFGEGGAGTYSDGKLYTRSHKRGDIDRILQLLVQFGAEEKIIYEAHPHIGTNKLPQIITAIREFIVQCGGLFLFEQKVTDIILNGDLVSEVRTAKGDKWTGDAVILATGHSARDIFELLHRKGIAIEFKPFALVRVEHPQTLIDSIQYHKPDRGTFLPPASYSLVEQVDGSGVFSFCMCPGGIIAPAATAPGEIVVNGWSPSKRNNPYANSGIVTSIGEAQVKPFERYGVLAGLHFQQSVEQAAFKAGGGHLVAPAQRMGDFVHAKLSSNLPDCSYLPGLHSAPLQEVLPPYVYKGLQEAFVRFGKKMKGYYTNEAVVVATESRTSSPVRIPREAKTLAHPQIHNLYPCGEGAGYAGGIVSAAMDGQRIAQVLANKLL